MSIAATEKRTRASGTDTGWLGRTAPVDLGTLLATASLQTRVDRKYLLPAADADALLLSVSGQAQVLDVEGRRQFGYESVYFDTAALDAYRLTATRRRRRVKVRTRTYLDSGQRWVEVKTAGPRQMTVKERRALSGRDTGSLSPDDLRFVCSSVRAAGVPWPPSELRPVLSTAYRRSTLLLPAAGARVTVDTDLRWSDPDGSVLSVAGLVVIETKGGAASTPVDRLLWATGHRPRALSKFATGLALLRPDLPANRWHRTLHELTAHAADGHPA